MNSYQYLKDPVTGEINQNMILLLPNIYIPNDPDNTDWQQYQEWLAAGNTPLPPQA